MAKSPEEMAQSMIDNLPAKTGKSLEEWRTIVAKTELQKHGTIVKMLKSDHGMTHGFANLVAHDTLRSAAYMSDSSDDELLDAQYAGAKSDLRPLYDALSALVTSFGKDVELSAKKAYVSLRRSKQFGIIKPSTKTRIDVGINLKGQPSTARLAEGKRFGGMVSHQVEVKSADDIDDELVGWLREAYERS